MSSSDSDSTSTKCHPEAKHYALGLCNKCYQAANKRKIRRRRYIKKHGFDPYLSRSTYERWLDLSGSGFDQEFIARELGIQVASLRRTIKRGKERPTQ